jgi:hypothetical protein
MGNSSRARWIRLCCAGRLPEAAQLGKRRAGREQSSDLPADRRLEKSDARMRLGLIFTNTRAALSFTSYEPYFFLSAFSSFSAW